MTGNLETFQKGIKEEASASKASSSRKRSKDGDEDGSKKRKQKKKKDPNAPKRAMFGFKFFSQTEREVSTFFIKFLFVYFHNAFLQGVGFYNVDHRI